MKTTEIKQIKQNLDSKNWELSCRQQTKPSDAMEILRKAIAVVMLDWNQEVTGVKGFNINALVDGFSSDKGGPGGVLIDKSGKSLCKVAFFASCDGQPAVLCLW